MIRSRGGSHLERLIEGSGHCEVPYGAFGKWCLKNQDTNSRALKVLLGVGELDRGALQ